MKQVFFDLGRKRFPIRVPDETDVLGMPRVESLHDPAAAVRRALAGPTGTAPLAELSRQRRAEFPAGKAVVVISDNTRPVPYKGEDGILVPILETLLQSGWSAEQITLLVAAGTHHPMSEEALRDFLDPWIFTRGIRIVNHDCRDKQGLVRVGRTPFGGKIFLNRLFIEADFKILTGLVESHFMAGVSGGRKSICPGLLADFSIYGLHGAPILEHPRAVDLVLEDNPVHEESLAVARMAGCDFIVNVTLDAEYRPTGVFAGGLEAAHRAAVQKLMSYAAIPVSRCYDLVITHAGFVGINHYQAAKGALVCLPLVAPGSQVVLAAFHPDRDPIGGPNYRAQMRLLGEVGPREYIRRILAEDWTFVPEQWQAQMWARLFRTVPERDVLYCTREIPPADFRWLPGKDARPLARPGADLAELTGKAVERAAAALRERLGREPRIAVLPDGPYGVPVRAEPASG